MRIPPSTVVMAVVTMVPFGLAIRDVAKGDDHRKTSDEREAAKILAESEAYERERAAELAAEAAADQAILDARTRDLPGLFGAEPASLGPAFGELRLGMASEAIDDALPPLMALTKATGIWFTPGHEGDRLTSIGFDLIGGRDDDDGRCDAVAAVLTARWGAAAAGDHLRVWRHPTTGKRAILDAADGCRYVIEPSVDLAAWVDTRARTAIVPLSLIGQRVDKLLEIMPASGERSGDMYTWTGPGVGAGLGQTTLTALVVEDKITALEATTSVADDAGQDALVAHLTTQLGPPTQDPDDTLHWARRPGLRLTREDGILTLTAGQVE